MRSADLNGRRLDGVRSRIHGTRTSVRVVVGALGLAAVVLAFLLRPGVEVAPATKIPGTPVRSMSVAPAPAQVQPGTPTTAPAGVAPTAIPTSQLPTSAPKERIHTVVAGDNLSKLAEKYYSDATKSSKIFEANKDILKNPNSLQVGQKLKIPD